MKLRSVVAALVAQLSCVSLSLQTNVTIPYVGDRGSGFQEYDATVVGISNDATTYNLNCPTPTRSAEICIGSGLPPYTVIAGPSTYEVVFPYGVIYERTACTLTGAPTPTTGTCTVTWSDHILTHSSDGLFTRTLPNTGYSGDPPWYRIFNATLVVVATSTGLPVQSIGNGVTTTNTGGTPTSTVSSIMSVEDAKLKVRSEQKRYWSHLEDKVIKGRARQAINQYVSRWKRFFYLETAEDYHILAHELRNRRKSPSWKQEGRLKGSPVDTNEISRTTRVVGKARRNIGTEYIILA